jgi:hypothetical protein
VLLNKPPRLPNALPKLPVGPRLAALRLLPSKPKRLPNVLLRLLAKLARLLNKRLKLNACKCNH